MLVHDSMQSYRMTRDWIFARTIEETEWNEMKSTYVENNP